MCKCGHFRTVVQYLIRLSTQKKYIYAFLYLWFMRCSPKMRLHFSPLQLTPSLFLAHTAAHRALIAQKSSAGSDFALNVYMHIFASAQRDSSARADDSQTRCQKDHSAFASHNRAKSVARNHMPRVTHTQSARLFAVVVCHAVWQREHSYSCINVYRTSSCASVCELRRLVAIIGYIAICASGGGRERVWFKGTVGRFIIKCRFIYGKSASVISNESWQFVWFFSERIALELLRKREVLWYFYCIYGYQLLLYSWFYSYVRLIKYSRN